MNAELPKMMQADSDDPSTFGRIVATPSQDDLPDEMFCKIVNDTDTTYVVFLLHDNNWMASLWGHPGGTSVLIAPGWKIYVCPANDKGVVDGDVHGHQTYWSAWGTVTTANTTLYLPALTQR